MNIIEFLDEVGHTKLRMQLLHECAQGATKRRGFTEVRFGTTEITPSDLMGNPSRVAMIIWIDREDFERVRNANTETTTGSPT